MTPNLIDLDSLSAQLEGLAQQVKQMATQAATPAADDLSAEQRLARLEDKLKALLDEPTVVRDKPQIRVSPPKRRDEIDKDGNPGISLLWWADQNLENVSLHNLKKALARCGYMQRMVHRNRMTYRVTPLGKQFFFEMPYKSCGGFPETFVNAAGQEELKRLYTAAKIPLRPFY